MYDKFYLSEKNINIINQFQPNQLLIIYGKPGTGKKTLAKEIMNNSTIHIIDSSFLKSNMDINDYLLNIVSKKNILKLMFQSDISRGI